MSWRGFRSELRAARHLPEVDAERCVHARLEVASCRRCVSACPTSAWTLDDEQLGIDPQLCDGCGLCVAACPEGALSHGLEPELRRWGGQSTAFASCERADSSPLGASVPCVHAYGLAQLARLYRGGVRRFFVCIGDCGECPRGAGERLSTRLSELNRLLSQRGLPSLVARSLTVSQWYSLFPGSNSASVGADLNRRGFMRSALAAVSDKDLLSFRQEWRAPGESLPLANRTGYVFHAPEIDIERCNGCDACARSCAHGVLTLSPSADAYVIEPDACTGCAMCTDVCDQDAIKIIFGGMVTQDRVSLQTGRCEGCGVDFHRPRAVGFADGLCHVCSRSNHRRALFQVL